MITDFRDAVFETIEERLAADSRLVILTNDFGAIGLTRLKTRFPAAVINSGIAEQNMIDAAAGLALDGRLVFVYGIAAHVATRPFEQIKLSVCGMNVPVIIIGVGSGLSYGADGPTHHATQDVAIMSSLPNLAIYNPADIATAKAAIKLLCDGRAPGYVRLDKETPAALYPASGHDFTKGFEVLTQGSGLTLISTGILTHRALLAAKNLSAQGIETSVIDVYRLKPLNGDGLARILGPSRAVVVLEEHLPYGGLSSLVAGLIAEKGLTCRFKRLSLGDQFHMGSAARSFIWSRSNFGDTLEHTLKEFLIE